MHKEFAEIYDIFMKYVNYDGWYKFLRTFIKKKGTVLDLGCGTGEFIWRFLKDGFSVIGVDLSEKMLEISEKKLKEKNLKNNNYSLINENIINYENKINFDENGNETIIDCELIGIGQFMELINDLKLDGSEKVNKINTIKKDK